ncbi:hypothetical protein OS493_008203, partial [Desmophyllum pertusum]
WFKQQDEFTTPFEEMTPTQLNKCLQKIYVSARKRDGMFTIKNRLPLFEQRWIANSKSPPLKNPFSIVGDTQFTEANKTLSNFLKTLSKCGEPTKHKQTLTKEVVEKLYEAGELVEFDTLHPDKLQQTDLVLHQPFPGQERKRKSTHNEENHACSQKKPRR